ncbi:MAG: hypothetical protein ABI439_11805 [Rhodospirillales bacterium]
MSRSLFVAGAAGLSALLCAAGALAHGTAGNRFFVASMLVEDPFVADELALPTISSMRERGGGDEPGSRETEISVEWAKTITPSFAISFEQAYSIVKPKGEKSVRGFGNLEVGFKYQVVKDPAAEFVLSFGVGFEVGGWGNKRVEADSFWSAAPTVYFGKGLGDVGVDFLRPLAITGAVGVNVPFKKRTSTTTFNPDKMEFETEVERHYKTLQWGMTLQYSLPYLQANVRDIGLGAPFERLVPIVEMAFETPLGGPNRKTTGTINPGFIWTGEQIQLGLEAQIPINRESGKGVGVLMQVHFYLDDIFPNSIGKPIFGAAK